MGPARLRCPSCMAELGDIPTTPQDSIHCFQCGYSLNWDADCWDACVDKTYPRDFARQWVLWEAGKLGDPSVIYGTPPEEWFRIFLENTSLTAENLETMRILEIGFGHGRLLHQVQAFSPRAYGLDLAKPLRTSQLRPGSAIFGNLLNNPFVPHQFDLVICQGVICIMPDPQKAFGCMAEQVAPGGKLYLSCTYEPGKGGLILRKLFPGCWHYPERLRLAMTNIFTPLRAALEVFRTRDFSWKEFRRYCAHYKLDIFDVLAPQWTTTLSENEIIPWYTSQGFLARKVADGAYIGVKTNGSSLG